MKRDYICKLIREYADEWVRDPTLFMPKQRFKELSAEKWAVEESIRRIQESEEPPEDVLVAFSKILSRHPSDWEASVANEVVKDLYYYILELGTLYEVDGLTREDRETLMEDLTWDRAANKEEKSNDALCRGIQLILRCC